MIVLASQSPRRRELLARILKDTPFHSIPSTIDERDIQCPDCSRLVLMEALAKGMDVSRKRKGDWVIASDTMVVFQGEELGKPKDENDAFRTLERLQGKEHEVLTGYVIVKDGKVHAQRVVSSTLFIHPMSPEQIRSYVATGSPMDKAGSYGIQDEEYLSTTILKGARENIMGFPIKEIEEDLRRLKILEA